MGRPSAEDVREAYAREALHRASTTEPMDANRASARAGATFAFERLTYEVATTRDEKATPATSKTSTTATKAILRDVTGSARPGEVLALMGPTGSGKTSLLNALAGRTPLGGDAARDDHGGRRGARRDVHAGEGGVRDAGGTAVSVLERGGDADAALSIAEGAVVGGGGGGERGGNRGGARLGEGQSESGGAGRAELPRGVSGGERKRVNIGVEMVGDPEALFLDEPTSGLDSFQAQRVVYALRQLAAVGRTVVCTIHQPRSSIYGMFDQLLLISEGRLLYIGEAKDAVGYFASLRFECPNLTNPADYFMDITSLDARNPEREKSSRERIEFFATEAMTRRLGEKAVASALEQHRARSAAPTEYDPTHASWIQQFVLLVRRGLINQRRDFIGVRVTLALEMMYALIVSALFRGVGHDQKGVQDRIGCLFFVVLNVAYTSALPAINVFAGEKGIVVRERASGAYKWSSYYMSKYVTELPRLIPRLIFCALVYWIVGLRKTQYNFWIFVAIIIAEAMSLTALGLLMASAMPIGAALALGPACITIFTLFGGIYLNIDSIPAGARWIRFMDPIFYAYSALVSNEFGGDPIAFSCESSTTRCLETGAAVLELYAFEDVKVGIQIMAQYLLQIGIHFFAFNALRRTSKQYMPLSALTGNRDGDDDPVAKKDFQTV